MRIIPAIDIMDGKCVRLSQGEFASKIVYSEDPVAVAQQFEQNGIKYLHLVDLDGAKSGKVINEVVLKNITKNTSLKVDFGGGISDDKSIEAAFENGATQVTIGSIAIKKPELFKSWINNYGSEKIILGVDVLDERIKISGWLEDTNINLFDFLDKMKDDGLKYVMSTDIGKDGMLLGPAFELYKRITNLYDFELIASGGISSLDDLIQLKEIGCSGAIIGKAIYEGNISLKELAQLC